MTKTTIYSRYNVPKDDGLDFIEPTMTQQHFKKECDINTIIDNFTRTGELPQVYGAEFADYSDGFDYQTSMNFLIRAQEMFDDLPAKIRKEFNNNPAELLTFMDNPENYDRGVELGLFEKRPVVEEPVAKETLPIEETA